MMLVQIPETEWDDTISLRRPVCDSCGWKGPWRGLPGGLDVLSADLVGHNCEEAK